MVNAFLLFAHCVFLLIVFSKKWQTEGLSAGIQDAALIGLLFSVGWSISTIISKTLMQPEGFGIYFDRDSFSLTLLTLCEIAFYFVYYKPTFSTAADKGKQ